MKEKLVQYLVCPECKASLDCYASVEDPDLPWREIMEGTLTCTGCHADYPIKRGIPRLLPAAQLADSVKNTVDGFGYEWLTYDNKIQNSFMVEKTNFLDFIYPITEDFFKDKLVLDGGCGMGRFLKLAADFGSREAIGIDLSRSVEAAYKNTRLLPNAHVVQADLMTLPFVVKFDYIFSIGVLQCTSNPQEGFHRLANLVDEGGKISAWVYSEENNEWVVRFVDPIRENITSKLPRSVLYLISQALGAILYVCLKLIYKPANEGKLGPNLASRLPYNDYLSYSTQLNYASLASVVFDHLVPELVVYISREEFYGWFQEEQLEAITITSRNNMSWRGVGARALSSSWGV